MVYPQTHCRLSISQAELKVQQGFRSYMQLCTQHLHKCRVVLLCLQREITGKITSVFVYTLWYEREDATCTSVCVTVVVAQEASPDDAAPVSSSSCTAVAIMGTLTNTNASLFWNKLYKMNQNIKTVLSCSQLVAAIWTCKSNSL